MAKAKRTTVWLYRDDLQAIERIRARWGLGSDSDAVRLALRILAASDSDVHLEPTTKEGESSLFTLWRFPEDREAIETLSRGELNDADVVRAAIRLLARSKLIALYQEEDNESA
jgi:Arc/MetJ-type ribon-helix-helix transcriptional regulator